MIGRRDWLRGSIVTGVAAWTASGARAFLSPAFGQSSSPGKAPATSRRAARKPKLGRTEGSTRSQPESGMAAIRSDAQDRESDCPDL